MTPATRRTPPSAHRANRCGFLRQGRSRNAWCFLFAVFGVALARCGARKTRARVPCHVAMRGILWQAHIRETEPESSHHARLHRPPHHDGGYASAPLGCDQIPDHRRHAACPARGVHARAAGRSGLYGQAIIDLDAGVSAGPADLAKMLDALEVGDRDLVLDIACGTGYSSAVLAPYGAGRCRGRG